MFVRLPVSVQCSVIPRLYLITNTVHHQPTRELAIALVGTPWQKRLLCTRVAAR